MSRDSFEAVLNRSSLGRPAVRRLAARTSPTLLRAIHDAVESAIRRDHSDCPPLRPTDRPSATDGEKHRDMGVDMAAFTDEELRDIQGFGIAGFNKDHQESLVIRIGSQEGGRAFVRWLSPQVANAWEVSSFNAIFREIRQRTEGSEPLEATWTALIISAAGFAALGVPITDLPAGDSATAFAAGMANRSTQIGDTRPGDAPSGWLAPFQPGVGQVHLGVVIASDDGDDLDAQVLAIYQKVAETGCQVVFDERGETLPQPLTGHEHFGFKDGLSQPVIVGAATPAPGEPAAVAPGEFVLGYPDGSGATATTGSLWVNGSYVVFRRLNQDVLGFRALASSPVPGANPAPSIDQLAAKMVGRWPSGAPIELHPDADPGPAQITNAFQFKANGDDDGHVCPVWAHIRKANPRDETTPGGTADDPTRHRIFRRGIPFGPPLPAGSTSDDGIPRGLHFYGVVADLSRQFEFVQSNWMNNVNFPIGAASPQPGSPYGPPPTPGTLPGGPDPMVGEHDPGEECVLQQASGAHPFAVPSEVVRVTAGEYFFLPSLSSLAKITT